MAKGHWDEGPVGPLRHVPGRAVESLPWEMGGLQRADIPAQVNALQAKVAARLLHPCWQAWKPLMRRAFQRYLPAMGPAVLVSSRWLCLQRMVWRWPQSQTCPQWSIGPRKVSGWEGFCPAAAS